jgi:hypothetical protein
MFHRSMLAGSALLLGFVLIASTGCQNQADPESTPTAKSKQVTVEITGMT